MIHHCVDYETEQKLLTRMTRRDERTVRLFALTILFLHESSILSPSTRSSNHATYLMA